MRKTPILVTKPSAICFSLKNEGKSSARRKCRRKCVEGSGQKREGGPSKNFSFSFSNLKKIEKTEKTPFT